MDYLEYLALLGHAEYLDAQGKFAEADKTIRIAQFGGFNPGGNLGGMFGEEVVLIRELWVSVHL